MKAELQEVRLEINLALTDVLMGLQRILNAMKRAEQLVETLPDEPVP